MIDTHRGAFEYDWRTRFRIPLSEIGKSMSWGEAIRHTETLTQDPSSQVCVAVSGWSHTSSWQALATLDLYDLLHQLGWLFGGKKGSRPKPHQRPWADRAGKRVAKPTVSQDVVLAALRRAGHTAPPPLARK